MVTINIWHAAAALSAAKAAGFDVDNIIAQLGAVLSGQADGKAIPAQLVAELMDVIQKFGADPAGTGMGVVGAVAVPELTGVLVGWGCDAFGLPKRVHFGPLILAYTVNPPKKRVAKRKARRRTVRRRRSPAKKRAVKGRRK